MKKTVLIFTAVLFAASSAFAAPKPSLNWGSVINSGACSMEGDLVVNAVMKITGDIDSGIAGNYWANDTFNKSIQIWTTTNPAIFCVRVMYLGKFQAIAGEQSPGDGTLLLTGAERGSVEGGYFGTVQGSLKSSPEWKTNGMVGNFDLGCDHITGACSTAEAASWLNAYFNPGADVTMTWWGWIYHGGRFGVWNNNIVSTTGNIFGG